MLGRDNQQDPYMAQIADDEDSDAGLDDVLPDDHLIVTCEYSDLCSSPEP